MNYKIEGISILLNKECILERYYPLISYKEILVKKLKENNVNTKKEALDSDIVLTSVLKDLNLVSLFKRFLNIYEINKNKQTELNKLILNEDEKKSFNELYLLPGVKETRARLYYLAGLKSLKDIANKRAEEIIDLTNVTIKENDLIYKAPLLKEVKTHIAVATVFTQYLSED